MLENMSLDTAIDSLFMMYCTCLLLLVVLGVSIFYSGLIQRRSSFTMLAIPVILSAFVFIDWFIWGYSLCYASAKNRFIGSLKFVVLSNLKHGDDNLIYATPRGEILLIIHFLFNAFMKVICVVLTFPGCIAERGRVMPMFVFIFFWSALVYNPVTYWFWNRNGWLSPQLDSMPVLDFAGGNCIHIVSGFTSLAYSYYLGPRNTKLLVNYRSSNNSNMIIGMCFLVFGWCGFIAGCDYKFLATSFYIITNTLLSASSAGIVWTAIDYYNLAIPLEGEEETGLDHSDSNHTEATRAPELDTAQPDQGQNRTLSMISFSSGVICGLVVFTPAGGYLSSDRSFWKSIVCGVVGGALGNLATRLKYYMKIDDALDIFAIHGVCGIVGSLLVGIFADNLYDSKGGWVAGHWVQFGYQLFGSFITSVYVFVMSLFFLYVVDVIPGLHVRIDKDFNKRAREMAKVTEDPPVEGVQYDLSWEKAELQGSDWYEFGGEYSMDFMEFIKVIDPEDYSDITIAEADTRGSYELHEEHPSMLRKREGN